MLTSLAYLLLLGLLLGGLCVKLRLPPLIGMLAAGMLLGPQVFGALDHGLLEISVSLRQLALVIILARAGLSLDLAALRRAGRPAILLCFVPALFEITGCILLAPPLLGVTPLEGAVIGSVVAAVSPAVVVPRMLSLIERGLGTAQSIPQMILAGASVDDVFVIALLSVTTGIAAGGAFSPMALVSAPLAIAFGLLAGAACGAVLAWLFRRLSMRDSAKVVVLLSASLLLLELETRLNAIHIPFSAMLGVMAAGTVLLLLDPPRAAHVADKLGKLWVGAELLLFGLVGAAVDLRRLATAGIPAALVILGALALRMLGVGASVARTKLTVRERLFTAFAYTPKATVQAAVGGVPLAMGLACGDLALASAVLSIVLTAPLGAFLIDRTAPLLLARDEKP